MPRSRFPALLALTGLIAAATPAHAGDDTEKLTLLGALGLEAASGKTTLGEGGGDVEAWLLASGTISKGATEIVARLPIDHIPNDPLAKTTYLLLDRDDTVDLAAPLIIAQRIAALRKEFADADRRCEATKATAPGKPLIGDLVANASIKPTLADAVGALKTDISISGIAVQAEDRLLMTEVGRAAADAAKLQVVIPSEAVAPADSPLVRDWIALERTAETFRLTPCAKRVAGGAALAGFAALKAAIDTPSEKSPNTRLEMAAALSSLKNPIKLLRVTVEHAGGTATVRSNIWYSVGFPGAVTLSSGLIASYRVIDPATGRSVKAGLIRCATRPMRFSRVAETLDHTTPGKCHFSDDRPAS